MWGASGINVKTPVQAPPIVAVVSLVGPQLVPSDINLAFENVSSVELQRERSHRATPGTQPTRPSRHELAIRLAAQCSYHEKTCSDEARQGTDRPKPSPLPLPCPPSSTSSSQSPVPTIKNQGPRNRRPHLVKTVPGDWEIAPATRASSHRVIQPRARRPGGRNRPCSLPRHHRRRKLPPAPRRRQRLTTLTLTLTIPHP